MKGFRNSPYKTEDYDSLTESEKENLYNKFKEENSEEKARLERLKVHRVSESEKGSTY